MGPANVKRTTVDSMTVAQRKLSTWKQKDEAVPTATKDERGVGEELTTAKPNKKKKLRGEKTHQNPKTKGAGVKCRTGRSAKGKGCTKKNAHGIWSRKLMGG